MEKIKDKNYEIRKFLLLKQITSYKNFNKLTQEEIIALIEKKYKEADVKLKTEISENLLSFLPKNNENICNALKLFIPYYNAIWNKNIAFKNEEIKIEINYEIFLRHILTETYKFIETIPEKDILSKVDMIAKSIEFSWICSDKYKLNLSVDPSKYKIFVNGNNKFDKMENLRFSLNFKIEDENIKKLFEIAKLYPIECDFNNYLLSANFINILSEFSNKFKTLEIREICKNEIDYKLTEYYENNKNKDLHDNKFKNFTDVFFKINEVIKKAPYLREYFPRFRRMRGVICLKFLEVDKDLDEFIDDVRRMVLFKTST